MNAAASYRVLRAGLPPVEGDELGGTVIPGLSREEAWRLIRRAQRMHAQDEAATRAREAWALEAARARYAAWLRSMEPALEAAREDVARLGWDDGRFGMTAEEAAWALVGRRG